MEEFNQNNIDYYIKDFPAIIKKGPNSMDFLIKASEGECSSSIFNVLPFVYLTYYDIHAHSLPDFTENIKQDDNFFSLQINYCIEGKTELMLDDNTYIYMNKNDFSISSQTAEGDTYFPLKYYKGISIYFEKSFFAPENQKIMRIFLPDASYIINQYLKSRKTFIGEADSEIKAIMDNLWKLFGNDEIFYKKLHTLKLLNRLMDDKKFNSEKSYVFYTNTQVEIAKRAEQILTSDLSVHIPIKNIAEQFGVSETSLKNYFRGVYGKNISAYLRDIRMNIAEEMLITTNLPISEIASRVGYTKQGKFAEVFKIRFGYSPLEYRRTKKLEQTSTEL